MAQSLGDGKATKLFLPQSMGDIFSLVAGWKETLESSGAGHATADRASGASASVS